MTADVKDLIERLRSNKLPECSFDDGSTWEIDGVAVVELNECSASALEAQAEEIARLKDERAFAVHEMSKWASACGEAEGRLKASKWPGVVEEWREHAETAERERDALKAENERLREAVHDLLTRPTDGAARVRARAALVSPPADSGEVRRLREALRVLTDAVVRYQEIGPLKGVRTDLAKGLDLGLAALDPDLGRIKPGHVCKHGIRWPHACDDCDRAALNHEGEQG